MTDLLKLTTVTASIASQSVTITKPDGTSGALTIKDLSGILPGIPTQDCPILQPRPQNFVANVQIARDTWGADAALKSITYEITYQLFYYPVGEGLNWLEYYTGAVTALAQILTYFTSNNNGIGGATDILPLAVPVVGGPMDDTGTPFHGAEITFRVMQFLEA